MYRYRRDDAGAGAEQHFNLSASSASSTFQGSPFTFSPFNGSASGVVDPPIHSSPRRLSPEPRLPGPRQPSHRRQESTESPSGAMAPPSSSTSPKFGNTTPARSTPSFTPSDRSLPSRQVTAATICDAYVAFILYCNPNFALNVDTTTLRANFQCPPKSDNKDFNIYHLFELIRKFEAKEIKTWGQLALDLGVEAPDVTKGQSVQKVQQYTVRLKRWMRAMHVDAFFEYLLGKRHMYFTEVPHPNEPYPTSGRDGVLAEEDLAIRALDPSFKPKRGRKRNSETETDDDPETGAASKRSRFLGNVSQFARSASGTQDSAMPMSAHPNNFHNSWTAASAVSPHTFAPWDNDKLTAPRSAVATSAPSQFRWQLHGNSQDASTPHPMTAQPTSMSAHIDAAFDSEPRSAVTALGRRKRKHGPAVSSAWPSANGPGAKPRGRPPANRNVQDGPFSTFPADPANDKSSNTGQISPTTRVESHSSAKIQNASSAPTAVMTRQSDAPGRPGRLSLQVPQHTGGPVRLASPPRVVINGDLNESEQNTSQPPPIELGPQSPNAHPSNRKIRQVGDVQILERDIPGFAFEVLKRALASDLLRAELLGRQQRLSGEEAKRLADSALERLGIPRADTDSSQDDIARLTAASWLGLGEQLRVPLGPATGQNKRVLVTRFRVNADGYEEIISAREDTSGDTNTREVFDLSWNVTLGACTGVFQMSGLSLSSRPKDESAEEDSHDMVIRTWSDALRKSGVGEHWINRAHRRGEKVHLDISGTSVDGSGAATSGDGIDWKARFMAAEFGARIAKGELDRVRERLIEKVLDVLM